jgi:hypothetical protein
VAASLSRWAQKSGLRNARDIFLCKLFLQTRDTSRFTHKVTEVFAVERIEK